MLVVILSPLENHDGWLSFNRFTMYLHVSVAVDTVAAYIEGTITIPPSLPSDEVQQR